MASLHTSSARSPADDAKRLGVLTSEGDIERDIVRKGKQGETAIFVDIGIIVAFHNSKDQNYEKARELVTSLPRSEFGTAHASHYFFDAAVSKALARADRVAFQLK